MRKLPVTLTAILFGTISASAVTITSFTATPDPAGALVFAPDTVTGTSDTTSVRITNTFVGCPTVHSGVCDAVFADFHIQGTDLQANTQIKIHMDGSVGPISVGTASAIDVATGTISFWPTGFQSPATTITHSYSVSGVFDKDISTDQVPQTLAAFDFTGTVSLALQPGELLSLPNSLQLSFVAPTGPAPVPEPSAALLLSAGLGLVGVAKWRKRI